MDDDQEEDKKSEQKATIKRKEIVNDKKTEVKDARAQEANNKEK